MSKTATSPAQTRAPKLTRNAMIEVHRLLAMHGRLEGHLYRFSVGWDDDRITKEAQTFDPSITKNQVRGLRVHLFGNARRSRRSALYREAIGKAHPFANERLATKLDDAERIIAGQSKRIEQLHSLAVKVPELEVRLSEMAREIRLARRFRVEAAEELEAMGRRSDLNRPIVNFKKSA